MRAECSECGMCVEYDERGLLVQEATCDLVPCELGLPFELGEQGDAPLNFDDHQYTREYQPEDWDYGDNDD